MNRFLRLTLVFLTASFLVGSLLFLASATHQAVAAPTTAGSVDSNLVVTTLEDELNADGDCSLREALQAANTNSAVDACAAGELITDTITFAVSGTITVTSQLEVTAGGPLVVDGGDVINTSGNGATRIWQVDTDGNVTLEQIAVVDGNAQQPDGAGMTNYGIVEIHDSTFSNHDGTGITNYFVMTIEQSKFYNNRSWYYGGAIYNQGDLIVLDSLFDGNIANNGGGGIYSLSGTLSISNSLFLNNYSESVGGGVYAGSVIITNSTFISNTALAYGGALGNEGPATITSSSFYSNTSDATAGAIFSIGPMTITLSTFTGNKSAINYDYAGGAIFSFQYPLVISDSTFSRNRAENGSGGAIEGINLFISGSTFSNNYAGTMGGGIFGITATITNSTFSANLADQFGGGIYAAGSIKMDNTTLSGNGAFMDGGGIYNYAGLVLTNTIVANSLVGGDCFGAIIDGGYNLDSDGTCGFDPANGSLPNTDPLLSPLQDNGGPTLTHALAWNSPAIDTGDNASCPLTDQRGVPRPQDGNGDGIAVCDIGAFELKPSFLHVTTLQDEQIIDGSCSLREAVQAANSNMLADDCGSGNVFLDIILFDVTGTITLTNQLVISPFGPLMIDGKNSITLSGAGTKRIWWVDPGSIFILKRLSVINGYGGVYDGGGGIRNIAGEVIIVDTIFSHHTSTRGAALYNTGSMVIIDSDISDNYVYNDGPGGGGIYNQGNITILHSAFYNNIAEGESGGAILNDGGTAIVAYSTFISNSAMTDEHFYYLHYGGAIYNDAGKLDVSGSTFISNHAIGQTENTYGGAISTSEGITITNSAFISNSAGRGGAVFSGDYDNNLVIRDSSFYSNSGTYGGAGFADRLIVTNSSFSNNTSSFIGGALSISSSGDVNRCTFSDNSSIFFGGAIYAGGAITVTQSSFEHNSSVNYDGGAIYSEIGPFNITNSTFARNEALNGNAGALRSSSGVIDSSTFIGNHAVSGGAIEGLTTMISNSTLSDNMADSRGGGIYVISSLKSVNSTLYGNSAASQGGGIFVDYISGNAIITDTIVANSISGGDCFGPVSDGGHNIDSDDSCGLYRYLGSMPATDPKLVPLHDNGGPTWTHALAPDSPAIDSGDNATCLNIDQRGIKRPQIGLYSAVCDIGAFEKIYLNVAISGVSNGLVGNSDTFTATVVPITTTLPLTYTWQAQGQLPITHTSGLTDTASFTWDAPGPLLITVTAENLFGMVSATHAITITDVPISGLHACNDSPTLLGYPVTLCTTLDSGTNVTYAWDFGDGENGVGISVMHTYPYAGEFTATVTATNSANTMTATTLVTILSHNYTVYLPLAIKSGSPPSAASSGSVLSSFLSRAAISFAQRRNVIFP